MSTNILELDFDSNVLENKDTNFFAVVLKIKMINDDDNECIHMESECNPIAFLCVGVLISANFLARNAKAHHTK